jgi:putative sigma-54 modulation protein
VQIDIKGRNVPVTDDIRTHAQRRLAKVARQVSDLARLEIEIFKEPNPRVADCHVAEATLYLKGITLRARDASPDMLHSLNLMVDELARQVKRHRDKLRHRREAHAAAAREAARAAAQGARAASHAAAAREAARAAAQGARLRSA